MVSVRPLCPELEQKAKRELNETPKKLEEAIQHLKEWIARQPHLRARTGIFQRYLHDNRGYRQSEHMNQKDKM